MPHQDVTESLLVGIDTGGTFTDFVVCRSDGVITHKVLSDPEAPERAILKGLRELGLLDRRLRLRHGSTVATNTVLEENGARVAYVSDRGLADVLSIARQNRGELYRLSVPPPVPPVPPELCFEIGGRLGADGEAVDELTGSEITALLEELAAADPEAVAINLLFSFLDRRREGRLEQALGDRWPVSCSSAVLPEIGEYERGIATWLNAYVGPRMGRYLSRLGGALPDARISVMQSDGLTAASETAARQGVRLLLSGPAGGLVGAQLTASAAGFDRLMTLDVGGTSTDVALIDGAIQIRRDGRIGRFPVAVPMVDMHTVGAGGGSIASLDAEGLLHVGPRSAGADPGPAAYGAGGSEPTVTDAFVVARRLPSGAALGRDGITLDGAAAQRALEPLADGLGRSVADTAEAVIRIANEHMAGALRVISVERGHDPRDFTLVAFGGAGGLHACELAELLGIRRAMIPVHAGVLSALGMAASAPGREATQAYLKPLDELHADDVETALDELERRLSDELKEAGADIADSSRQVDLRYLGQSFTLTLPWPGAVDTTLEAFHAAHARRFGHELDSPVELVNLRVRIRGAAPEIRLAHPDSGTGRIPEGPWVDYEQLPVGAELAGPRTIMADTGAAWIAPGWVAQKDDRGNLLLSSP